MVLAEVLASKRTGFRSLGTNFETNALAAKRPFPFFKIGVVHAHQDYWA